MPSSLTRVLSSALGFSPRPPVSVCGTGASLAPRGDFLGSMGSRTSGLAATSSPLGVTASPFHRMRPAYGLEPGRPSPGCATPSPSPLASTPTGRYRNINLLSITYAFRPRLRARLTLGGLTFPQETLGLRRTSFSLVLSLLISASALQQTPPVLAVWLRCRFYAPLPIPCGIPWLRCHA